MPFYSYCQWPFFKVVLVGLYQVMLPVYNTEHDPDSIRQVRSGSKRKRRLTGCC